MTAAILLILMTFSPGPGTAHPFPAPVPQHCSARRQAAGAFFYHTRSPADTLQLSFRGSPSDAAVRFIGSFSVRSRRTDSYAADNSITHTRPFVKRNKNAFLKFFRNIIRTMPANTPEQITPESRRSVYYAVLTIMHINAIIISGIFDYEHILINCRTRLAKNTRYTSKSISQEVYHHE